MAINRSNKARVLDEAAHEFCLSNSIGAFPSVDAARLSLPQSLVARQRYSCCQAPQTRVPCLMHAADTGFCSQGDDDDDLQKLPHLRALSKDMGCSTEVRTTMLMKAHTMSCTADDNARHPRRPAQINIAQLSRSCAADRCSKCRLAWPTRLRGTEQFAEPSKWCLKLRRR